MTLLKEYFALVEDIAFGHQLAKYKATFTEEELNTEKAKLTIPLIPKNIHDIMKKSRQEYKEFILSKDKNLSPARCKAFSKIGNIEKLLTKFFEDPQELQYPQIAEATTSLLNDINNLLDIFETDKVDPIQYYFKYYGMAKSKESLENSFFKILPDEIIIKIFEFVDDDMKLNSKVDVTGADLLTSASLDI